MFQLCRFITTIEFFNNCFFTCERIDKRLLVPQFDKSRLVKCGWHQVELLYEPITSSKSSIRLQSLWKRSQWTGKNVIDSSTLFSDQLSCSYWHCYIAHPCNYTKLTAEHARELVNRSLYCRISRLSYAPNYKMTIPQRGPGGLTTLLRQPIHFSIKVSELRTDNVFLRSPWILGWEINI